MPYKDLQKRKEYHKLYMLEYEKKPERKEYLRKWHLDNKEKLKLHTLPKTSQK